MICYGRLSTEQAKDYDKVKEALMKREAPTVKSEASNCNTKVLFKSGIFRTGGLVRRDLKLLHLASHSAAHTTSLGALAFVSSVRG
ncbi:hypothetical protein PoB_000096800 [Plakobranchus ocellatus]|uniref:Resolvase/invertase-type recombinase catalytic domain-containing protein n=1 Tax=Plakobranchus ocellatus TaxID=259542 RepID=A0AAV3XVS9_9GAST|nr:hypothetical protein PoB_000096800 [Plakobranchus ocellatus]